MMKYGQLLLIIIFAIVVNGCGNKEQAMSPAPPLVKTQQISAVPGSATSIYAGEVRGRYESQLAFQVDGKIIARHVELGSRVQAGDVLLELDTKDIAQTVNSSIAQVESAQAQLNLATANLRRYRQLYAQAAVSAAQYEQYQTTYDAALAMYKQAEAQYNKGSNALNYTQLRADNDGVIAALQAEIGQVIGAGQNVLTVVKSGELEVEINIPENRLMDMPTGTAVTVKFWALPKLKVNGVIREISPIADKIARTYKARVALLDPPESIKLAMTASVQCEIKAAEQAMVLLPLTAIYQTSDQPQVWVVQDNQVELRTIAIESFADNQVWVTSGLQIGDIVVSAGVHKLRAGQKVRVAVGDGK